MGAFPGSRLVYGIDLGGDDPKEFDSDQAMEQLKETFGNALELNFYGNLCYGHIQYVLTGHCKTVYAYSTPTITPESLAVSPTVTERIKKAYALLFPGEDVPEPRWMITVHYG